MLDEFTIRGHYDIGVALVSNLINIVKKIIHLRQILSIVVFLLENTGVAIEGDYLEVLGFSKSLALPFDFGVFIDNLGFTLDKNNMNL